MSDGRRKSRWLSLLAPIAWIYAMSFFAKYIVFGGGLEAWYWFPTYLIFGIATGLLSIALMMYAFD